MLDVETLDKLVDSLNVKPVLVEKYYYHPMESDLGWILAGSNKICICVRASKDSDVFNTYSVSHPASLNWDEVVSLGVNTAKVCDLAIQQGKFEILEAGLIDIGWDLEEGF